MNSLLNKIGQLIVKYWKEILIVILAIGLFFLWRQRVSLKQAVESTQAVLEFEKQRLDSTVTYWQTEDGKKVARIESLETTNQQRTRYIDSLAKIVKTQQDKIRSISVIDIETVGRGEVRVDTFWKEKLIVMRDSSHKYSYTFDDGWANIRGTVGIQGGELTYRIKDTLTIVDYYKKRGLFGKQRAYVDIFNSNPNTTVVGAKKVSLNPPNKYWGIGLGASLGYPTSNIDWRKPVFTIGISVQRTFIRF